ncbi:hypothetical protein [Streptococcus sp. HMSC10E12]|uniref:hypothetical protein n=1 Tax=Streptococcus sp. HMSC10E12 TaxID=1581080 RepID=UPI0008A55753|nr:hypothetical protein [Streptococcus sp. HMSC10E12]OFU82365.1 hypothetical protein HMPREF3112_09710 [Streptococcus sp. HMSC10E12]
MVTKVKVKADKLIKLKEKAIMIDLPIYKVFELAFRNFLDDEDKPFKIDNVASFRSSKFVYLPNIEKQFKIEALNYSVSMISLADYILDFYLDSID